MYYKIYVTIKMVKHQACEFKSAEVLGVAFREKQNTFIKNIVKIYNLWYYQPTSVFIKQQVKSKVQL